MLRATAFAQAFVNAAQAAKEKKVDHWVARAVEDRAEHTTTGIVKEPDVRVRVSQKQRLAIALNQRVIL